MLGLNVVVCVGLLLAVYSSTFCNCFSTSLTSRADGLQQRLKQLTAEGGIILLDGDNVRGKTKFQLSKEGQLILIGDVTPSFFYFIMIILLFDAANYCQ